MQRNLFAISVTVLLLFGATSALAANTASQTKLQQTLRATEKQPTPQASAQKRVYTKIGGIAIPSNSYAQSMIRKYIAQYTTSYGKQDLYKILDDAEGYRLYVRQELKKRNMPTVLEYLPVVESNYKPLATSRSGARGLWQFMENSIKGLLHKDEWVDERLDPWLSTDAALRKLQDNYNRFKDWPLALAAYNCGAGAMSAILKKSPQKSFWYISEKGLLRDQSVQYVPKLLAICELAEHGASYGVTFPAVSPTQRFADFDYITTNEQLWLSRLEGELRMESGTLSALNPALLQGCTPPKQSYRLRLPSGMAPSAELALATIHATDRQRALPATSATASSTDTTAPPSRSPSIGESLLFIKHSIVQGETLYSLSRYYGCTVEEICAYNSITKNTVLSIGKTLYIPVKTAETK